MGWVQGEGFLRGGDHADVPASLGAQTPLGHGPCSQEALLRVQKLPKALAGALGVQSTGPGVPAILIMRRANTHALGGRITL